MHTVSATSASSNSLGISRRYVNLLAVICVYYLVAAASFSGFFSKWAFLDDNPNQGIVKMFDGTAMRPWAYRQLMPVLADGLVRIGEQVIPAALRDKIQRRLVWYPELSPERTYSRATAIDAPQLRTRYLTLYYLCFVSLLICLVLMRQLCLQAGIAPFSATLAPLLFALVMPLLQTRGGVFLRRT
jgi:hypothetical protein